MKKTGKPSSIRMIKLITKKKGERRMRRKAIVEYESIMRYILSELEK